MTMKITARGMGTNNAFDITIIYKGKKLQYHCMQTLCRRLDQRGYFRSGDGKVDTKISMDAVVKDVVNEIRKSNGQESS